MELIAVIMNTKAVAENANHDRSGNFRFPLNKDEIRERLNFDNDMSGWSIWVPDSPLENVKEDTPLEEMNRLYFKLESLEGKIHEKDIKEVAGKWFHGNIKELSDNAGFIKWMHGRKLEELAEEEVQKYFSVVPGWLLKSVNISMCVLEMFKDEERYLVATNGIYEFDEPVY